MQREAVLLLVGGVGSLAVGEVRSLCNMHAAIFISSCVCVCVRVCARSRRVVIRLV